MGLGLSLLAACAPATRDQAYSAVQLGDRERGRRLLTSSGCGACHSIPGITAVDGEGDVGPPLTHWSQRSYIAGVIPNTPERLLVWLRDPQSVKPGDAMPDLGLSERDASDIAAYLYSLR